MDMPLSSCFNLCSCSPSWSPCSVRIANLGYDTMTNELDEGVWIEQAESCSSSSLAVTTGRLLKDRREFDRDCTQRGIIFFIFVAFGFLASLLCIALDKELDSLCYKKVVTDQSCLYQNQMLC